MEAVTSFPIPITFTDEFLPQMVKAFAHFDLCLCFPGSWDETEILRLVSCCLRANLMWYLLPWLRCPNVDEQDSFVIHLQDELWFLRWQGERHSRKKRSGRQDRYRDIISTLSAVEYRLQYWLKPTTSFFNNFLFCFIIKNLKSHSISSFKILDVGEWLASLFVLWHKCSASL